MLVVMLIDNKEAFIEQNKYFIYHTASNVCKKRLAWENDDELSIAMIAFNNACDKFSKKKGNFYSFAKVVIKNAIIDYYRKAKNTPYLIFQDSAEENTAFNYIENKISLDEYEKSLENQLRAEEIDLFTKELVQYKLSFSDLVNSSPSHKDTRNTLLNIALLCAKNDEILQHIKTKKLLPIKEIVILTNANRKYLEKWRRYLLALILIISDEKYPFIKSYLNIKVDENEY